MKRFAAALLCALLSLFVFLPGMASAAIEVEYTGDKPQCASAVLMDAKTGKILYSIDPEERVYPASTTKIMSALIILEKGNLDDVVTVQDSFTKGSVVGLRVGDKITLRELLYCMLLASGNDAAVIAAKHISGTTDAFVTLMNQKAKALGMTGTNFKNPSGLQDEEHYTTAADMAKLTREALKNEELMKIVGTAQYTLKAQLSNSSARNLENTNKLISVKPEDSSKKYQYATGMKTGSTNSAKGCLLATAKKDGMELIFAIFGAPDENDGNLRWRYSKELFSFAFENYEYTDISSLIDASKLQKAIALSTEENPIPEEAKLTLTSGGSKELILPADIAQSISQDPSRLKITADLNADISLPVEQGEVIGSALLVYENDVLASCDITAAEAIAAPVVPGTSQLPISSQKPQTPNSPRQPVDRAVLLWLLVPVVLIIIVVMIIRRKNRRKSSRYRSSYARYKQRF